MALSNCMASAAVYSSQSPVLIPRHGGHCSTSSSSLGSAANVCPRQTIPSSKALGFRCCSCRKVSPAAVASARKGEGDGGMNRLQEEDLMELEFGQLLGESADATMRKVLARKSNPSLSYIDIERSIRKHGMEASIPASFGPISEYIEESRQMMNLKGRDKNLESQTVKGNLPKLLRPLSRPNVYLNESQASTEEVVTQKSERRGSYVDLVAKPVRIKQEEIHLLQPEEDVIPPALTRGDQAATKEQSAELGHQQDEGSFSGQVWNPLGAEIPADLGKDMFSERALNFSSLKNSQSGLLKGLSNDLRELPTLLSKPNTANALSSAKARLSTQVNAEKETKDCFVRASQDQLRSNNVNIHAQSTPASGATFDGQEIRSSQQDAFQNEIMFIEKIKANGQFLNSVDESEESMKRDSIADKSVQAGKTLKLREPMNPSNKPSLLDVSFETHSESLKHDSITHKLVQAGKSLKLHKPVSPSNKPSLLDVSFETHSEKQLENALTASKEELLASTSKPRSLNTNLRKPTFNLPYSKKDDKLVNNEISDCLENEEGDLKSEKEVDGHLESADNHCEPMNFVEQPKSQVPSALKMDGGSNDTIRQHYPPSVLTPEPLLQKTPEHAWSTSADPEVENKDRDWARVEALKCARAVVEVKLVGTNSGGMLALLGSLVGFLPVKELGPRRGLRSFAVWARERGYSITQRKMASNELEADHLPTKLGQMPNQDRKVHSVDEGASDDRKESLDALQMMYRKEKAEHLASLVGEKAKVIVTYVDKNTQKLLVSERQSCDENLDLVQKKVDLMANLKVGDIVTCIVKQYATFGIFVDLQGVPAFIHRTELSWNLKVDPSSFCDIGHETKAVVTDLNFDLQRINLSIKRLEVDPLYETLESLSVAETDFIPDVSESVATGAEGSEVPELEALFGRLKESEEIIQVIKGRRISSKSFAPEFQVYLSARLESGYKLLARFGNEVQEIYVKTDLPKENVKNIISSL